MKNISKYFATALFILCLCGLSTSPAYCQDHEPSEQEMMAMMIKLAAADAPRGLIIDTKGATKGYKLFAPLSSDVYYLTNNKGEVVHTWKLKYATGAAYIMDNGNLIASGRDPVSVVFAGGGQNGYLFEYDWEGNLLWEYKYSTDAHLIHHDFAVMPNGNILAIAWEAKTAEECARIGRKPENTPKDGLWPDSVIEIEPEKPSGGRIVWEWHMWDHMIQDYNESLANYGNPADHPELIDINLGGPLKRTTAEKLAKRKSAGLAAPTATVNNEGADIYHCNAINYNAELDQIVISSPNMGEIFIIDHSTNAAESSGHAGGRYSRGGDLLYRWGNPQNYGRGSEDDEVMGEQHDVQWIPEGLPGAGNLTIFNNHAGMGPKGPFSAAFEITPPMNDDGSYQTPATGPYGPEKTTWEYVAPESSPIFAPFISSVQRLENGNTLVSVGPQGRFFEVTHEGEIVWEYWMPYIGDVYLPDGSRPQPTGPFHYAAFRVNHFEPDHPAFKDRKMKALKPQPEILAPPSPHGH
jgi:arylsulfotransferase ASST